MANPRGRGGTAQDAHAILAATTDPASNTISYSTAGHPDPVFVRFPLDRLGDQCRQAMWAMIPHAQQGGRWAAASTIRRGAITLGRLHQTFLARGIAGFEDPNLSFGHVIEVRDLMGEPWRSSRAAVAWALRAYHPGGDALAEQVLDDRISVASPSPTLAFDESVARTIEAAARSRFLGRLGRHKEAMRRVGVDVSDSQWLRLDAAKIVATGRRTGSSVVDALVHYVETGDTVDDDVRAAVSVHADDLAAAMVLLCLAENLGPNLAAIQSMTARSVIHLGGEGALVDMMKSRAGRSLRVASSAASLHTLGGLATALVGLTRFARAHRTQVATTPEERRQAELLFVADGSRIVLGGVDATGWGRALAREIGQGVSIRRLRETANLRGKRATGRGTVIGHSAKSNMAYLAEGMPADELARLVVEAQDDIVSRSQLAIARDTKADAADLNDIARTSPERLVERGVATCTSSALDPETSERCNRGIVGCFTCPSGFRTDANLPGLKATVVLTNAIRSHDPDEWANGPAQLLNAYATAALAQFGAEKNDVDSAPMVAVVAALYNEVRG